RELPWRRPTGSSATRTCAPDRAMSTMTPYRTFPIGDLMASRTELGPERLTYSVSEAALITGLSRDLLYDQMRPGRLAFIKVGRRRLITRTDLQAFPSKAASSTLGLT